MDHSPGSRRYAHPVRGVFVTLVLGPPMVVFGLVSLLALIDQFLAGFVPDRWFSNNILDWMTSFGTVGGTADYITFMLNGMLAYLCYAGIVRAFTGKVPDPSK